MLAWHVGALALGLAAASLWPLAAVFSWFGVNVATLEQMGRTDPFGFRVLPALLMFARPFIAAAAVLQTPFVAIRVATSHPQFAFRILRKAAIIQAALALTLAVTDGPVNTMLARMLPMFPDRHTPGALVTPGHFVALQRAAADSLTPWLFGIALGFAALAVLAHHTKPATKGPEP